MSKKKRNKSGNPAAGSIQTVPGTKPAASVAQATYSVAGRKKSPAGFYETTWFEWLAIAVVSGLSYWFLTARLVGINVSVLIDEYLYVLDSHYKTLAEATYPNHLFQLVYRATKQCGPEFYSCARSLNAIFVVAGAVFLYLLAKHISGRKWLGAIVASGAVLGSYGTYTAYFMPEAIFNFPMVVFFWAVLRFRKTENLFAWAGFGLILGVASLAKPHAFFVIPAVVIFIILMQRSREKFLLPALGKVGFFLASFFATKFLFGFVISGERGLSVLGNYASLPQAGGLATEALAKNSGLSVIGTSWGQTLMITMIVGVALAVAVHGILSVLPKSQLAHFGDFSARTLIGLSLLNMMAVSAIFEAWGNLDVWMHTRYYSYLIPLAGVVLLEAYARSNTPSKPLVKRIVVVIFLVVAAVALFTAAIPYGANWIDAPDFKFHIDNLVLSSIFIIVSMALAIWWLWDSKTPLLIAVIVSLIASMFSGSYISNFLSMSFGKDSTYDQLGRVLRDYLPQDELDKTVLIGENQTLLERALFVALTGQAKMIRAGEDAIAVESLDPSVRWLVKVGQANISGLPEPYILGTEYSIYSLKPDNQLTPRNNDAGISSNACAEPANLGWVCGTDTLVSLSKSVSPSGEIDLIIDVSEEASTSEIEFVLGESVLAGTFPKGIYSLTLSFTNVGSESELLVRTKQSANTTGSEEVRFVRIVSANVND
jgi:phosphoglycerol transferase